MSRKISQETYDAVVKENIDEFSMSPTEAIASAIAQFECQVHYKITIITKKIIVFIYIYIFFPGRGFKQHYQRSINNK